MKNTIILLATLLVTQGTHAMLLIDPNRCAFDSLEQWSPGNPIEGTSRGRNAWFKGCDPAGYGIIFPGGFETVTNGNRRSYPTYGRVTGVDAQGNLQFDPNINGSPWRAPTSEVSSADDTRCKKPEEFVLVGLCTSGCVTPESLVETPQGTQEIAQMTEQKQPQVLVPMPVENGNISSEPMDIERYTSDMISVRQDILVITTKSGASIRLSVNHPLLDGEFIITRADAFKVGDSLVSANGNLDEIVSIEPQKFTGKLHNLTVASNELDKSLYIVQGFISGDKKYQDLETSDLNRKILRRISNSKL